jgi:hypothetical protein
MANLNTYAYRLMRAATLDRGLYEEVEADRDAMTQALVTVVLSSVAAGIGAGGAHGSSLQTFAVFSVIALVTWLLWAALILRVGGTLMPEQQTRTSLGELLRTIGFAAAPGLLQVFAAFAGVMALVFGITALWMLAAMVIAVRQALDYRSTRHALIVCAVAWALAILLPLGIAIVFSRTVS